MSTEDYGTTVHNTYTRKSRGINEETVRDMYGNHKVLCVAQFAAENEAEA